MNVVNQITLDEETQRRAEARANELGVSFTDYVRRLLADDLGRHAASPPPKRQTKADISILFDLGASAKPTNIARDKDKLIGEAVWEEHLRSTGRKQGRPTRTRKDKR